MSRVRVHNFSISLDGFGTGEALSAEAPFGHARHRLHEWMAATRLWDAAGSDGADNAFAQRHGPGIGAEIMGAGKFGPPGWQDDPEWRGWWGADPPFHTPTYVLTHRPRASLEMDGGTTFHFLDAEPGDALAVAREAAGGQDIRIGGGPSMRVPRRRARRPPARRAGADPARSRRPAVGRARGARRAVRRRGGLDAERRRPSHVHAVKVESRSGTRHPQASPRRRLSCDRPRRSPPRRGGAAAEVGELVHRGRPGPAPGSSPQRGRAPRP
jgi:dihydrofolate reductase